MSYTYDLTNGRFSSRMADAAMAIPGVRIYFRHYALGEIPFIGRFSAMATGWDYTHVAIEIDGDGWVYEAAMRSGVRKMTRDKWLSLSRGKENIESGFRAVDVRTCNTGPIREFLESRLNAPYDWLSVIGHKVLGIGPVQSRASWYCSEYIYEALKRSGCLPAPAMAVPSHMILPLDLYKILTLPMSN